MIWIFLYFRRESMWHDQTGWMYTALFGSFYENFDVLTDRGLTSSRREWRCHGEIRFVLVRPASGTCASWSSRDDTTVLLALALPAESQTKSIHPDEAMGLLALKNGRKTEASQLSCRAHLTRCANAKSAFGSRLLKSILQILALRGFSVAIVSLYLVSTAFSIFMQL